MGTQRISGGGGGCHGGAGGGGGGGGTQGQKAHALAHQGSFYNLTLEEVQLHLGDLGKPISSMNLDELLKTVRSAGANQGMDNAVFMASREGELGNHLRQKTVDEVWQDIQQGQSKRDSHSISRSQERQTTLGEMTLEDFLVKAGVVAEAPPGGRKTPGPSLGEDQTTLSQGQAQWVPYELPSILRHPQQQQQNMMSVYMPGHQVAHQSLPVADAAYPETTMAISPAASLMGPPSDTMTAARKRSAPGGVLERTVERRHKRMIKNRESAARSRARKQAYTNELENKVSHLEEENERLRRKKMATYGGGRWGFIRDPIPAPHEGGHRELVGSLKYKPWGETIIQYCDYVFDLCIIASQSEDAYRVLNHPLAICEVTLSGLLMKDPWMALKAEFDDLAIRDSYKRPMPNEAKYWDQSTGTYSMSPAILKQKLWEAYRAWVDGSDDDEVVPEMGEASGVANDEEEPVMGEAAADAGDGGEPVMEAGAEVAGDADDAEDADDADDAEDADGAEDADDEGEPDMEGDDRDDDAQEESDEEIAAVEEEDEGPGEHFEYAAESDEEVEAWDMVMGPDFQPMDEDDEPDEDPDMEIGTDAEEMDIDPADIVSLFTSDDDD